MLIFIAGGYGRGAAPILDEGKKTFGLFQLTRFPSPNSNGDCDYFAVTAFALTLFLHKSTGTDDVDAMLEDNA